MIWLGLRREKEKRRKRKGERRRRRGKNGGEPNRNSERKPHIRVARLIKVVEITHKKNSAVRSNIHLSVRPVSDSKSKTVIVLVKYNSEVAIFKTDPDIELFRNLQNKALLIRHNRIFYLIQLRRFVLTNHTIRLGNKTCCIDASHWDLQFDILQ